MILAGPNQSKIEQIIKEMTKANLDITVKGDLQDFLGVNIERKDNGTIHPTQPHLIDKILKDLRLDGEEVTDTIAIMALRLRGIRRIIQFQIGNWKVQLLGKEY